MAATSGKSVAPLILCALAICGREAAGGGDERPRPVPAEPVDVFRELQDEAGLVGQRGRRLYSCSGDAPEPLLWKLTRDARTVYLFGNYLDGTSADAVPELVQNAMGCSDAAFLELACASSSDSVKKFMGHCSSYVLSDETGSIFSRVDPATLAQLKTATSAALAKGASGCEDLMQMLQGATEQLDSSTSHMALLSFYFNVLQVFDAKQCTIDVNVNAIRRNWPDDTWLRTALSEHAKPIFGLEDVATPCSMLRANAFSDDVELAFDMLQKFGNDTWPESFSALSTYVSEVVRCGDLETLSSQPQVLAELAWVRGTVMAERNQQLASSISQALSSRPGEVLFVSIGALHFLDIGTARNVLALLQEAGFTVDRLTTLTCTASQAVSASTSPTGADQCLTPPFRSQPASCGSFSAAFDAAYSQERPERDDSQCQACANATTSCSCTVAWPSASAFDTHCTSSTFENTTGKVMTLDVTRNGGSVFPGPTTSERHTKDFLRGCYATTCEESLLQEVLLRQLYQADPVMIDGQATLKTVSVAPVGGSSTGGGGEGESGGGTTDTTSEEGSGGSSAGSWGAFMTLLVLCGCVALATAAGMYFFRGRKRGKSWKTRSTFLSDLGLTDLSGSKGSSSHREQSYSEREAYTPDAGTRLPAGYLLEDSIYGPSNGTRITLADSGGDALGDRPSEQSVYIADNDMAEQIKRAAAAAGESYTLLPQSAPEAPSHSPPAQQQRGLQQPQGAQQFGYQQQQQPPPPPVPQGQPPQPPHQQPQMQAQPWQQSQLLPSPQLQMQQQQQQRQMQAPGYQQPATYQAGAVLPPAAAAMPQQQAAVRSGPAVLQPAAPHAQPPQPTTFPPVGYRQASVPMQVGSCSAAPSAGPQYRLMPS